MDLESLVSFVADDGEERSAFEFVEEGPGLSREIPVPSRTFVQPYSSAIVLRTTTD